MFLGKGEYARNNPFRKGKILFVVKKYGKKKLTGGEKKKIDLNLKLFLLF